MGLSSRSRNTQHNNALPRSINVDTAGFKHRQWRVNDVVYCLPHPPRQIVNPRDGLNASGPLWMILRLCNTDAKNSAKGVRESDYLFRDFISCVIAYPTSLMPSIQPAPLLDRQRGFKFDFVPSGTSSEQSRLMSAWVRSSIAPPKIPIASSIPSLQFPNARCLQSNRRAWDQKTISRTALANKRHAKETTAKRNPCDSETCVVHNLNARQALVRIATFRFFAGVASSEPTVCWSGRAVQMGGNRH